MKMMEDFIESRSLAVGLAGQSGMCCVGSIALSHLYNQLILTGCHVQQQLRILMAVDPLLTSWASVEI